MEQIQLQSDINFYDSRFLMFVMDNMAYEYEKENKDVLRLTLGKSELPLNKDIISGMQDALGDFKKSSLVFPGGLPELKDRLSLYYLQRYGVTINPQNFVISAGTSSIFRNLFYLLLKEGDEVLLPLPYYSLYNFCAQLVGAKVRFYKIDLDTLSLDIESFKENFTSKTKVVVINSPGNPLGNILTSEELYTIDSIVNGQAVVINDEIYANIVFNQEFHSVMQLQNTKSHFITTDAFSKGFRMYSRRVGYCIVPEELVMPLTVIQHHTLLTLDPVVQFGAITALDYQHEVDHLAALYKERCNYTMKKLKGIAGIRVIESKGGFYITLECSGYMRSKKILTSLELAEEIMRSKFVAVVPGSDFGICDTLRLSFSNIRYNEAIDRLADFFA